MADPPRHLMEPDPDVEVDYHQILKVVLWVIVWALSVILLVHLLSHPHG